ncbi:MAG: hypothetical protein ACRDDZ_12655 [Marinifilaceae bacterium]
MAIAKGPLGQVKGRMSNTTSYMLEGQMVMRALPISVRQPETDKQLQARCRLMLTARLGKLFGGALEMGFMRRDTGKSVRAQFSSINGSILGREVYTPGQVPWQSLSLSRGELAIPYLRVSHDAMAAELNVEVLPQATNAFTQPDDEVLVCVVRVAKLVADCPDKSESESWPNFYKRYRNNNFGNNYLQGGYVPRIAEQTLTINNITAGTGEHLWVYYFAFNRRTKEASTTQVVSIKV